MECFSPVIPFFVLSSMPLPYALSSVKYPRPRNSSAVEAVVGRMSQARWEIWAGDWEESTLGGRGLTLSLSGVRATEHSKEGMLCLCKRSS